MKSLMIAPFLLSLGTTFAQAQQGIETPIPSPEPLPPASPPVPQKIPRIKSWYLNFGGGLALTNYSSNSTIQNYVNTEKNASAANLPISVDMGIYWPVFSHLLVGIADTGFSDSYAVPSSNTSGVAGGSVIASNILLSSQYFPFNEAAWGWFFRGDIGYASVGTSTGGAYFSYSGSTGTGIHVGAGYAFPIIQGAIPDTRIPLILSYSSENVSSGIVSAIELGASFMF